MATPEERKPPQRPRSTPATFASLAHRNYRLWFVGQLTSLFGTWMQSTAQGYLVFQITQSSAWLGYVGFSSGLASWLFTLHGGMVADRVPRRSLLVVTQSAAMLLAAVLSALTFGRVVAAWHVLVLAFLLGVVNAFDAPARQSFVLEMVGRDDLTNAIALNSTMFNTATALGPAVGGMIYAALGPGWCFALNALSFVAVIAALLAMRLPAGASPARGAPGLKGISDGFAAIARERRILALIALVALVSLFGFSFTTLLPAWAVRVLGGDARTNGLLQSARGVGALVAALGIASMGQARRRGRILTAATFAVPVAIFGMSLTRALPLSLLGMFLAGGFLILIFNLANALVQTLVPDEVRGRVMGVYTLAFMGVIPIGSLVVGALAQSVGEPLTLEFTAAASLSCAFAIALAAPDVRRLE